MLVSTTTTRSSPFHSLIESVAVPDVDKRAAAREGWERRDFGARLLAMEQIAKSSLDQVGRGPVLARGLTFELSHDGVVDIERRLHMGIHGMGVVICQSAPSAGARGKQESGGGLFDAAPPRRAKDEIGGYLRTDEAHD
jgi:hypothetical protein